MELILTGDMISAEEAKNLQIVNAVHPPDQLMEGAMKLAKKITKHSQIASAFAKRAVLSSMWGGLQGGVEQERSLFMALFNTEDKKEGV
mmetsp:Transcript_15048/g.10932  ORF Transcript_15048/g.10932 Transcript_15048/m.10932 type:complete len:89 (+) Transcript_15048:514-780(+)